MVVNTNPDAPSTAKPRKSILKNGNPKTFNSETPVSQETPTSTTPEIPVSEQSKSSSDTKSVAPNSGYSSPVGSPTPITCSQHCCGSLFARCAQHGRSQLLQTFTDLTSPLSRETFLRSKLPLYYRYPSERSISLSGSVQKPLNLPKNFSDDALVKHCRNGGVTAPNTEPERFLFDDEAVSRLYEDDTNKTKETPCIGEQEEESTAPNKTEQSLVVRRHNSLPNSEPADIQIGLAVTFEDSFGRRATDSRIKNSRRRSSTPVREIQSVEDDVGNDDVIYYIPQSPSTSEEELQDEEEELTNYQDFANGEKQVEKYYMGNGVVNCHRNSDQVVEVSSTRTSNTSYNNTNNNNEGLDHLRDIVPRIRKEAKEWEVKADLLETQVLSLKRELKKRNQENGQLQREIHKLKSVLQQTKSFIPEGELLTSVQDSHGMPGQTKPVVAVPTTSKKQGVSGESSDHGKNLDQIQIERYEKDFRSKQLIKDAIMENDFLKNLDSSQLREIVESMFPRDYPRGSYVIKEGDAGSHLYVSAEGELEVIKEEKVLGRMGPRKAFGELAILYNCRRTASIRVVNDAKVWALDRRVFQQIMMRTALQRLQDNVNFLKSVPLLHNLNNDVLSKIADVLEVEFYPSEAHIIRQGANGDTFFIIRQGNVKVTQRVPGRREEEEIRVLSKGDYFGEQALLKEDIRTANVIALNPGVECLTLDRDSFIQLIGDLSELQEKDYGDESRGISRPASAVTLLELDEYDYIRLDDLDVVATLGVGGFGRVELVQYIYDRSLTFALKCLKKQHIVDTQQQEHVYSERNIMKACNSPFIARLYRTFRDSKYVYMMLEACLGGEVWTILRDRGCFDDSTTQFVTACVLEAFEYLHARGIIYRDLKPENLLLDNHGYVKLVDFGFSKRLGYSAKTWTFCGTPEYVAPEIILNKGHDRAVDYWSLGVLMHELLTGTPPFTASDPMKTYNIILKGIDMVDFPKHITRAAQSLIKRLCRDSPSERLGYQRGGIQDIKKHKWFQGFHWDGLKLRQLVAPIIPQVRGPVDTTNFDCYPKEHEIPADEFSNWDADF